MRKTINVGGGGLELAATAATPYRYKQVFRKDLFKLFQAAANDKADESDAAEAIPELAYIMNQQAEGADMNGLSFDDYLQWLDRFGPVDLLLAGEEIMNFYNASSQGSVQPKKE